MKFNFKTNIISWHYCISRQNLKCSKIHICLRKVIFKWLILNWKRFYRKSILNGKIKRYIFNFFEFQILAGNKFLSRFHFISVLKLNCFQLLPNYEFGHYWKHFTIFKNFLEMYMWRITSYYLCVVIKNLFLFKILKVFLEWKNALKTFPWKNKPTGTLN